MTATESVTGAVLPDKRAYVPLSCIWRIVIVGEEDVNVFHIQRIDFSNN